MKFSGLVLEGGGMRGTFTAGVLDSFIDAKIEFPYVIGTSAGASCGAAYVSKQRGRSRFSNVDLHALRPYIGLKYLLSGKGIIDMDFLFFEYPERYYQFDFDTFKQSNQRCIMVASNALTGKAEYFEDKENNDRIVDIMRASCSLPLLCPMWHVDNVPMVDGGVCDSIPIMRAIADGNKHCIVILTKVKGYRKSKREIKLPSFIYRKFPKLKKALEQRNKNYNACVDFIEEQERLGNIYIIRPSDDKGVGRCTKNATKLQALYNEGIEAGQRAIKELSLE